jgi:diacylglycerol kinase family enzyme
VIHNPTAGRRAAARLAHWLGALERLDAPVELAATNARGHAEALTRAADPGRYDAVAVAGGDGTLNEAANGLAASPLPLAILPCGTANVLARELGIPLRGDGAARIAAFAPARPVWPGEVLAPGATDGRRFLLMAGVGFDAEVVEALDLGLKRRIGRLAYAAATLARLRGEVAARYPARIDGAPAAPASLVACRSRFYGGRFVLAPAARLDEPRLQVVLFERGGRRAALAYLGAMLAGRLAGRRDLRVLAADRVELDGPAGAAVQLDGDVRARLPAVIRIAPTPLMLAAPAGNALA